jgi:N-acetylneuraminate synthase
MPWEWHAPIFELCKELSLDCFSTAFDHTAVDFLEDIGVPCYKIASFENTDTELVRKVAKTGKPLIISTGMANLAEIDETVRAAREAGCENLVLLKCTSSYPASPAQSNLLTIPHMRDLFGCEIGLSDHTLGVGVAVASVALGASVIEKHFILSRSDGGPDSTFSMEPDEMKSLVIETERAWLSLGKINYGPSDEKEEKSKQFRRSLYIVKDMNAGDEFNDDNIRAIRPGMGLPTKYISNFLGKKASRNIKKGTPVNWDLLG